MKLYYLSESFFAYNEMNLLHHLTEHYDITYGVIIPKKNYIFTESEIGKYCKKYNINFHPFHIKYRLRDLRGLWKYYKIVCSIKKSNPDIIIFINFDVPYINILLLILNKEKTIIGIHDVKNHSKTGFQFVRKISKNMLFKKFKYFLTYSNLQANILKKRIPNKKVYTIPLLLTGFGKAIQPNRKGKIINFLFFGYILYYKGLDILLNSVNRLSKKYNNFKITIAGGCENWNELYEDIVENKDLLIKEIRFIKNSEIPNYFSKADYAVFPYRDTTQSGALMTSYYYNVPVITSNAEGFKEFINPNAKDLIFDIDNELELDIVLEKCIRRSETDYEVLKKEQRVFIDSRFLTDHLVNQFLNMFKEIRRDKH